MVHTDDTGLAAFTRQEQRAELPELAFLAARGEELVIWVITSYGAQGGRGGEERVDGVFGADAPEGAGVGGADGFAFEEHGRGTGEEGRVEDVGVPDYPADVRGAEHDVAGAVNAEEVADREIESYGVAAGFAEDAFGETGGACVGVG